MLADQLIQILREENISVTQLAAKLYVSSAMVSMVISGNKQPGMKMLAGLDDNYHKIYKEYWSDYKKSVKRGKGKAVPAEAEE